MFPLEITIITYVFLLQDEVQQLHLALGKLYDSKRTKEMLEGTLTEELKPKLAHNKREVQNQMDKIAAANDR